MLFGGKHPSRLGAYFSYGRRAGLCDLGRYRRCFYLPEGTHERHQSHTNTKCAGYGEWGCIFDAYKRLKPEAYLTKKAFTPILLDESKTRVGKELQLYITNRFDHVCLTEVHITVSDKAGHILYHSFIHEAIEPHQSGWIRVPILQAEPYIFASTIMDI